MVSLWQTGAPPSILLFVLSVSYMPLLNAAISIFQCTEPIDGVRYLSADVRVRCEMDGSYVAMASAAIFTLAVVGIGFPALIVWRLSRASSTDLRDPSTRAVWSFLFDGYLGPKDATVGFQSRTPAPTEKPANASKEDVSNFSAEHSVSPTGVAKIKQGNGDTTHGSLAHWEAVIIARKAMTVIIARLIDSSNAQLSTFVIISYVFAVLHLQWRPYTERRFFNAELASMSCLLLTASLGILMLRYPDSGVPPFATDVAPICLLLANLATALGLVALYVQLIAAKFLHRIPALRRHCRHLRRSARSPLIAAPTTAQSRDSQVLVSTPKDGLRLLRAVSASRHALHSRAESNAFNPVSNSIIPRNDGDHLHLIPTLELRASRASTIDAAHGERVASAPVHIAIIRNKSVHVVAPAAVPSPDR